MELRRNWITEVILAPTFRMFWLEMWPRWESGIFWDVETPSFLCADGPMPSWRRELFISERDGGQSMSMRNFCNPNGPNWSQVTFFLWLCVWFSFIASRIYLTIYGTLLKWWSGTTRRHTQESTQGHLQHTFNHFLSNPAELQVSRPWNECSFHHDLLWPFLCTKLSNQLLKHCIIICSI